MITTIQYIPNTGSPITLNDLNYPLSVFEMETEIDQHALKRLNDAGEWPTYHYPAAMTIHAEGVILGSGATPSTDYVTKRLALLDAILPPVGVLTARRHGYLRLRLDGMTEDAEAEVVCMDQQVPMRASFPAVSDFMITWKAFKPVFVGVSSQTNYQLG